MNKRQLAAAMADYADIPKSVAERALGAFCHTIAETLPTGEPVVIKDFGTFDTVARKERVGRNPQTGEEITIPASNKVTFKAGKYLKGAVNQ